MASAPMIGAIETEYAGVRFRSRTEARWAVFFDALGLKWEHEPEAYTDGRTWYTPDFWLPELDRFWEVKGTEDYDLAKVSMLCEVTGKELMVSYLSPADSLADRIECLDVHCWHREPLDLFWGKEIEGTGITLSDNELHVWDTKDAVISNRYAVDRVGGQFVHPYDLLSPWQCIVKAATLATRFRFWEPNAGRRARVTPVCAIDRGPELSSVQCEAVDSAAREYMVAKQAYDEAIEQFDGDWGQPGCPEPPDMPVYPSDCRVVSAGYDDRHDNLARKWFYELSLLEKRQVKKVYGRCGSIQVEFYPWAKGALHRPWEGPRWFECRFNNGWATGDGDWFGIGAI